jgi:hypothetical protein
VPFLRRSIDGRWQVGQAQDESPDVPIDPDARVVGTAVEPPAARR